MCCSPVVFVIYHDYDDHDYDDHDDDDHDYDDHDYDDHDYDDHDYYDYDYDDHDDNHIPSPSKHLQGEFANPHIVHLSLDSSLLWLSSCASPGTLKTSSLDADPKTIHAKF